MSDGCQVNGCPKPPPYVRGMCQMHYTRWKRGVALEQREERRGLCFSERLWQYIDVREFGECWEWTGRRQEGEWDYGQFMLYPEKRCVPAHRVAYETFWRTALVNKCLHYCNNPPCCNPLHLYDGTTSQNALDAVAAGTAVVLRQDWRNTARGERVGLAKLTEESVREIRRRYAQGGISQQVLADEFGVNQTQVSNIVLRRTWAHVE